MNDDAHIIEIDSLVLTGIDTRNLARLRTRIETEVRRVLHGSELSASTNTPNAERRVAAETAGIVTNAIRGGRSRV